MVNKFVTIAQLTYHFYMGTKLVNKSSCYLASALHIFVEKHTTMCKNNLKFSGTVAIKPLKQVEAGQYYHFGNIL